MDSNIYPQLKVVPIRMLQPETAEKFLDGIASIPGIRRVLVHGPGYMNRFEEKPRDFMEMKDLSSTPVKISDQNVNMQVLMGDVIVEACNADILEKVADYCFEFFDDSSFQMVIGSFMKTRPSMSDYFRINQVTDPYLIGMSDSQLSIEPAFIKQDF